MSIDEKEVYQKLKKEISAICDWASKNSLIRKVYIYGSRARGDFRTDSDLDVAVEIEPRSGDTNSLTTWFIEAKNWKKQLQPFIRMKLHLEWYDKENTPTVHAKISAGNIVIYEK